MSNPSSLTTSTPGVDVVIPFHNRVDLLVRCVESVIEESPARLLRSIVLVDDASTEDLSPLRGLLGGDAARIALLTQHTRTGFSGTSDAGIRAATAPLVVLLNSDTQVGPGWLEPLHHALLTHPRHGMAGPLSNAAGFQSFPRYRRNAIEKLTRSTVRNPMPSPGLLVTIARQVSNDYNDLVLPVPFLNGFCLAMRRDVYLDLGGFDRGLFPEAYGEEIDFCLRAREQGWLSVFVPSSFVAHEKSASYRGFRKFRLVSSGVAALKDRWGPHILIQSSQEWTHMRTFMGSRDSSESRSLSSSPSVDGNDAAGESETSPSLAD